MVVKIYNNQPNKFNHLNQMRKYYKYVVPLLIVGVFYVVFTIVPAYAQRVYYGLIISPAVETLGVKKGEVYKGEVRLTHDFQEGKPIRLYPYAISFIQDGETGNAKFIESEEIDGREDASKWISFEEENYYLEFGDTISVSYTITVPDNATPGGHYVALIFSRSSEGISNDSGVGLGQEIGDLLLMTVEGEYVDRGELVDFQVVDVGKDKEWYAKKSFEFLPVYFSIRYKNTGTVHTHIGGNIFIHKGDLTKPIATLKVNETSGYTLPNSIRNYVENWNSGWITKDNSGTLVFNKDNFLKVYWGNYQATLMLKHTVDGERVTSQHNVTFSVIPWRLIVVVVLCVIIISALVFIFRRNSKKSKSKMSKK